MEKYLWEQGKGYIGWGQRKHIHAAVSMIQLMSIKSNVKDTLADDRGGILPSLSVS